VPLGARGEDEFVVGAQGLGPGGDGRARQRGDIARQDDGPLTPARHHHDRKFGGANDEVEATRVDAHAGQPQGAGPCAVGSQSPQIGGAGLERIDAKGPPDDRPQGDHRRGPRDTIGGPATGDADILIEAAEPRRESGKGRSAIRTDRIGKEQEAHGFSTGRFDGLETRTVTLRGDVGSVSGCCSSAAMWWRRNGRNQPSAPSHATVECCLSCFALRPNSREPACPSLSHLTRRWRQGGVRQSRIDFVPAEHRGVEQRMGVRILKARMKRLERFPELETCTFVWDDGDEASEDAVRDLLRWGATVEDAEAMPRGGRRRNGRSRATTVH
jgi:hypothetical protein